MDHNEIIETTISGKYRNKVKIKAWISATGQQLTKLSIIYQDMTYNVDDAEGIQLDFIGYLVDLERKYTVKTGVKFFGYEGTTNAVGYNVEPYYDFSQKNLELLKDELFRRAIKAKILLNVSDGTMDSAYRVSTVFLDVPVIIHDHENMTFEIEATQPISPDTGVLIGLYDLYVKPDGVEFLGYIGV